MTQAPVKETTLDERDALAARIADVSPEVWLLWCEDGLPPGVYRLRDESRATADRLIAEGYLRPPGLTEFERLLTVQTGCVVRAAVSGATAFLVRTDTGGWFSHEEIAGRHHHASADLRVLQVYRWLGPEVARAIEQEGIRS